LLSIGNLSAESGSGANAGRVAAQGSIGRILIGNSLQGSDAANTGSIFAGRDIGSVKIDGGIFGHLGAESGSIVTGAGRIGSVQVDLIVGGLGLRSASIRSAEDIGSIKVNKNVGGNAAAPILFTARGQDTPGQTTDLAIGKISIGGDVTHANIIAGVDTLGVPLNADAQIGSIKVGGDWTASSIAAGIDDGADNLFGTDDDTLIDEAPNDDPNIVARVGKISIGGAADGSSDGGDAFGFVAEEIGSLSIDGVLFAITTGKSNDSQLLGSNGDFSLVELG
jgi:hypothetical protein